MLQNNKYLETFSNMLAKGATVLHVGYGIGKPIDNYLIKQGFAVNGISISLKQVELAKKQVPEAFYEIKNILELKDFEYCVDGILSLDTFFHIPREARAELFRKFATFMPKGGPVLATIGNKGQLEVYQEVKKLHNLSDIEKNKEVVENAGFEIILNEIDETSWGKHQVILAKKG